MAKKKRTTTLLLERAAPLGRQLRLFHGRVLVSIEPELTWPSMWRVRLPEGHLAYLVNLPRAKDAAALLALGVLSQHWEAA